VVPDVRPGGKHGQLVLVSECEVSVAVDEYAIECVLERELVARVRIWDGCSGPCDRVQVDLQREQLAVSSQWAG
jgi:hypothetical protein